MAVIPISSGTVAIPTIADDDILIVQDGDQVINQSTAHPTIDLQGLIITEPFEGLFGDADNPVNVDVSNVTTISAPYLHYLARAGAAYIGAASRLYDNAVIDSERGTLHAVAGTWASTRLVRGRLIAAEAAVFTTFRQWAGRSEFGHNATGFTLARIMGGPNRERAYSKTQRDGLYELTGPATLEVDHTNSTPAIHTKSYDERALVRVIEGDIDDIEYEKGYINALESRAQVSLGSNSHFAGPASMSGIAYDVSRHTVSAATNLGSAVRAPAGIPAGL